MAQTLFDTIADLIVARLEAGTYMPPYKPVNIVRPNQEHKNYSVEPYVCVVQLVALEPNEELNYVASGHPLAYNLRATYMIAVAIMQEGDDKEPQDAIATTLICDLAKAITVPADTWHQWNGNALMSRWKPAINLGEDGSITEAGLMIEVDTRVSEIDPYTFRA